MSKVVIFINETGMVSVINPSPEAVDLFGIEAIAMKDVPAGRPFKIIDASQVPDGEWSVDPSALTDGVGGNFTSFG